MNFGSLIPLVGDIIGGAVSAFGGGSDKDARRFNRQSMDVQRQNTQMAWRSQEQEEANALVSRSIALNQHEWSRQQWEQQKAITADPYGYLARSARGAGLHPLFALGASPSVGGGVNMGGMPGGVGSHQASYAPYLETSRPSRASEVGRSMQAAARAYQNYVQRKQDMDLERERIELDRSEIAARREAQALRQESDARMEGIIEQIWRRQSEPARQAAGTRVQHGISTGTRRGGAHSGNPGSVRAVGDKHYYGPPNARRSYTSRDKSEDDEIRPIIQEVLEIHEDISKNLRARTTRRAAQLAEWLNENMPRRKYRTGGGF